MFRKRIIIIFILSLFILESFSQDSVYISNKDLRTACLIFAEHQKFSIENPLLKQKILSLEELNQLYVESDSIQRVEISTYKNKVDSDAREIKKLKNANKRIIIGSSIGGILLFILGLII